MAEREIKATFMSSSHPDIWWEQGPGEPLDVREHQGLVGGQLTEW